jgi:hypothetical protein
MLSIIIFFAESGIAAMIVLSPPTTRLFARMKRLTGRAPRIRRLNCDPIAG